MRSPDVVKDSSRGPAACAQFLALSVLLWFILHRQVALPGHRSSTGTDFRIYWAAGRFLRDGQNPYQPVLGPLGFVYPPWALLPFRLLAELPVAPAFQVWLALQAIILALLVVLAIRGGMRLWWAVPAAVALACDGYVYRCSTLGQVGILLLGLVALDFVPRTNRRWRGLLTGIAVGVKFTPAIFLVHWVVRREWRAAAMGSLGFAGTVAAGWLLAPTASRHYWGELVHQHRLGTGVPKQYGNANNQSLTNAVQLLWGPSPRHALVGTLLGLLCAAVAFVAASLAGRDRPWLTITLLGTASCLVTGSTWDHHYVWSVAAILALLTGELAGLWAPALLAVAWLFWSLPRRWHRVATIARHDYTRTDLLAAVATPALAVAFVVVSLASLLARRQAAPEASRRGNLVRRPSRIGRSRT